MSLVDRVLAKLEVWKVARLIKKRDIGEYYLKKASEDDLAKIMDVKMDSEEFDGLVYRRKIIGFLDGKMVIINVWSSGISIVRVWVQWSRTS